MSKKNPRAVIYTRVSTAHQGKEGTSLETQYAICRRKADGMGAVVVAAFEEQQSGGDYLTRQQLQAALDLIESGEADTLIIYDMSRYSRDSIHQQQILQRVLNANGNLVFATFDTGDLRDNPEGRLAFGVQGVFAEYERLKIRSRMMQGRRASAEKGLQVTHSAPFGYEIATRDKIMAGKYKLEDHKKYFVVEHQAVIVRDIYKQYAEGASLYGICKDLNLRGIPTAKGYGGWNPTTIRAIVKNPAYKGEAQFGRYQYLKDESRLDKGFKSQLYPRETPMDSRVIIPITPIVDVEIWDRCQQRLAENQSRLGGRPKRKYTLSGLVICPNCGRRMGGTHHKGHPIFTCTAKLAVNEQRRCDSKAVGAKRLEALVMEEIAACAVDVRHLEDALSEKPKGERQVDSFQLRRDLKELEKREKAIVEAQIRALQQGISSAIYEQELRKVATQSNELRKAITEAEATKAAPKAIKSKAQKIAAIIAEHFGELQNPDTDPVRKNLILREFIMKIVPVHGGRGIKAVQIFWRE